MLQHVSSTTVYNLLLQICQKERYLPDVRMAEGYWATIPTDDCYMTVTAQPSVLQKTVHLCSA